MEGRSGHLLVQTLLRSGSLQQVAQGCVWLGFEYHQGWTPQCLWSTFLSYGYVLLKMFLLLPVPYICIQKYYNLFPYKRNFSCLSVLFLSSFAKMAPVCEKKSLRRGIREIKEWNMNSKIKGRLGSVQQFLAMGLKDKLDNRTVGWIWRTLLAFVNRLILWYNCFLKHNFGMILHNTRVKYDGL